MPGLDDDFLLVYAAVFVATFIAFQVYSRRLRTRHPDAWASLGSPTFFDNSALTSWRSVRFLLGRRYRELGDQTLTSCGDWARIGCLAILIMLILGSTATLAALYVNAVHNRLPVVVVTHPLSGLDAATLFVFAALLVMYGAIGNRLKSMHPAVWQDMGAPSFLNQRISNRWSLPGFVLSSRYRPLNDFRLDVYVAVTRVLMIAILVLAALLVGGTAA